MKSIWPKKTVQWIKDKTLYLSIPFTWELPNVKAILTQTSFCWNKAVIRGPAIKLMPDYINMAHVEIRDTFPGMLHISVAGKMEGIEGKRSGLWSEMFRVIRDIRPGYVVIENSPALIIRGFEKVLCNLSEIRYNAEWQVFSNVAFGYPHERERLYVIAYSDEKRLQRDICTDVNFKSIFKMWTPNKNYGYSLSKRVYEIAASSNVRNGNGFRHWTHKVGSIGNAVNPTIAYYLFECIKQHFAKRV